MITPLLLLVLAAPPQSVTYANPSSPAATVRLNASDWSTETGPAFANDVHAIILRDSPKSNLTAALAVDENQALWLSTSDGSSWSTPEQLSSDVGSLNAACFDAAFERSTGALLLAYRKASSALIFFRVFDPSNTPELSIEDWFDAGLTAAPDRIMLRPKLQSDEILLVSADGAVVRSSSWSSSSFGATETVTGSFSAGPDQLDASWGTGQPVVAWVNAGDVTPSAAQFDGSNWDPMAALPSLDDPIGRVQLAASDEGDLMLALVSTHVETTTTTTGGDSSGSGSDFDVVYTGGSFDEGSTAVTGTVTEGSDSDMPNEPSYQTGGSDLDISKNSTVTLSPGKWEAAEIGDGATINLTAGDYFIEEWDDEVNNLTLNADTTGGAVRFFVTNDNIQLKNNFEANVTAGTDPFEIHIINGSFEAQNGSTMQASLVVYNGNIELGNNNDITGFLIASGNIESGSGTIEPPAWAWPGETVTTTPVVTTTTTTTTHAFHTTRHDGSTWSSAVEHTDDLADAGAAHAAWEASGGAAIAIWQQADSGRLWTARTAGSGWGSAVSTAEFDGIASQIRSAPDYSNTDTVGVLAALTPEAGTPLQDYVAYSSEDDLDFHSSVTVTGTTGSQAGITLPPIPSKSYGSTDVKVKKNKTTVLSPGAYRKLTLEQNSRLELSAGDYIFQKDDKNKKEATIHADTSGGRVRIFIVTGSLNIEKDSTISMSGPGPFEIHILDNHFRADDDLTLNASIICYNGEIDIGDDLVATAHLIVKDQIKIDKDGSLAPPSWDNPFEAAAGSGGAALLLGLSVTGGTLSTPITLTDAWEESHAIPFDLSGVKPASSSRMTQWREVPSYDSTP